MKPADQEFLDSLTRRGIEYTAKPVNMLSDADCMGALVLPEAPKVKRREKRTLLPESFFDLGDTLIAVVPVETTSEVNGREWQARNRRTGKAWQGVSRLFGPRLDSLARFANVYHDGKPVHVRFVRIGGRHLDPSNLPTATKAVEDALAYMMGASDGDNRWRASWGQVPETATGVRITISLFALPSDV